MKAIKERNRLTLAALELAKDKNFHLITADERVRVMKEALKIGDEVASWAVAEFGTADPRKIAEKVGAKIFGRDKGQLKASEYRKEAREIVIFRDTLDKLTKEVTQPDLSERLLRLLIAHELFHHLEETRIGPVYKRFKFPGKWWTSFYIKGLSEVAAQSFTQALLEIEISPPIFDYLTYILYTSAFKA